MQLNPFTVLLIGVILLQFYSVYNVRNKIWCTFRRVDRTKINKWAKNGQGRIEFDGGWYEVEPARVTLALKWEPLPTWVRTLDFRHDSSRALDPDTFDNQYTPEARKQLDKTDDIRALEQGNQQALSARGGKQGLLERYMPFIVVIGFVVIGFFLYNLMQHQNQLGVGQNTIEVQLGQIMNKLPK
jgi:preprotein translocase subunit SecG